MKIYSTSVDPFAGTDYEELAPKARQLFNSIRVNKRRKAYVRSKHFGGQKIFLDLFWDHLHAKNRGDRNRRLKYFPCALDLLRNTRMEPTSKPNPNGRNEILHRFAGETKDKRLFFVQVKEDKRNGNKYLMSVFPPD